MIPPSYAGREYLQSSTNRFQALPLEGTRILTFSSFGAGPWSTMMLADLGAEVIKIENRETGGDTSRSVPPLQEGIAWICASLLGPPPLG